MKPDPTINAFLTTTLSNSVTSDVVYDTAECHPTVSAFIQSQHNYIDDYDLSVVDITADNDDSFKPVDTVTHLRRIHE